MFIIGGLIVYGSSQILFGLATEVWVLFLARFLSGTGAAFIMAPIMAFVADITTYEERGKGMGMIGAAMSLGFMIGPGVGGFLSEVNLTFPFFLAGTVAYMAAILSAIYLPNIKNIRETIAPREKLFQANGQICEDLLFYLFNYRLHIQFWYCQFPGNVNALFGP